MTGVTVLKLVDPIYTILMEFEPLRELLETLYDRYNRTEFIAPDPISVPHRFEGREDREIAGFLSATIAWGNRRAIVGNACRMMSYMDNAPADFVKNASEEELRKLTVCVHRTFNGEDLIAYVRALRSLFRRYGSLGEFFGGVMRPRGRSRPFSPIFAASFSPSRTRSVRRSTFRRSTKARLASG